MNILPDIILLNFFFKISENLKKNSQKHQNEIRWKNGLMGHYFFQINFAPPLM